MTLSSSTILGQAEPGRDGNEGVFWILQIFSITVASPSDCLASYLDSNLGVFPLSRNAVGIFYSPSSLGYTIMGKATKYFKS